MTYLQYTQSTVNKIMTLIDDHKHTMSEFDYIQMCNVMKNIHETKEENVHDEDNEIFYIIEILYNEIAGFNEDDINTPFTNLDQFPSEKLKTLRSIEKQSIQSLERYIKNINKNLPKYKKYSILVVELSRLNKQVYDVTNVKTLDSMINDIESYLYRHGIDCQCLYGDSIDNEIINAKEVIIKKYEQIKHFDEELNTRLQDDNT